MLVLEAAHRAHAVVELAIRDLKAGGLAHLPSGIFTANAAWLALAVLAHNLGRWTLAAAGGRWSKATTETLRTKLVSMPARLVHSARRLRLRAPTNWPWPGARRSRRQSSRSRPPRTDLIALRRPTIRPDPNDPATPTRAGPVGMPTSGSETAIRPRRGPRPSWIAVPRRHERRPPVVTKPIGASRLRASGG
jgi:hypothetical protein